MIDRDIRINTSLRDGTPVLIRQVQADDKEHLQIGMSHLSPETRHFRFFTAAPKLTDGQLKHFTEMDHHNHDAWGAFDVSTEEPEPVGIARYIRQPDSDLEAEFAVTVVDSHQGRGLGSLLLGIIASRAADNGIQQLHSVDLAENHSLFSMLDGLKMSRHHLVNDEVELTIPIHADARDYPPTMAGDVLRKADRLYRAASH